MDPTKIKQISNRFEPLRTWQIEIWTHSNPSSSTKTDLRTNSNPFKKAGSLILFGHKQAEEPLPKSGKTKLWTLPNPGSSTKTELQTHLCLTQHYLQHNLWSRKLNICCAVLQSTTLMNFSKNLSSPTIRVWPNSGENYGSHHIKFTGSLKKWLKSITGCTTI